MSEAAAAEGSAGRGPTLPGRDLLDAMGFVRIVEVDAEAGRVRAEFDVLPRFCHTDGTIAQGGFVTAWLDFSMAQAALVRGGPGVIGVATLELKVSFLQRVGPGRVIAEGRVQRMGRRVAFLEASLHDPGGALLANASSTAIVNAR
ncbi:MAG: PaaI family thioesterase [Burkholderiales bacterium]|nr:MAG: PaaI family thioesterase [Burkholderiales bacterium]